MGGNVERRSARRFFFGSYDRAVGTFGIIFSFISTVTTLILLKLSDNMIPRFIVIRDVSILIGLLCVIVFLALKYSEARVTIDDQQEIINDLNDQIEKTLIESLDRFSNAFKSAHGVVHEYRDELFDHYHNFVGDYYLTGDEINLIRHVFYNITYSVRDSLLKYFRYRGIDIGEDVSVSVKLVLPTDTILERFSRLSEETKNKFRAKENWIITIYRDHYTHHYHKEREVLRAIYDIGDNTIHDLIVNGEKDSYICNNLRDLGTAFKNTNPGWEEQYNATIAVPIRYRDPDDQHSKCYGLITADSKNPQDIDDLYDQACFEIMSHAANLLATFFLSMTLAQRAEAIQ